jgi:ABC-type uncharacterized transport system substrate-binding protein
MVPRMSFLSRVIVFAALSLAFIAPAHAHPHVWVTMKTELVYAPDGTLTGIRHAWAFDDMFSAFATQGLESKEKGKFTREELAPLAKVNVESLKEFGYFTFVTADGDKVALTDPKDGEYYLDYTNSILTLHFTLPLKKPVKAKDLRVEIYDETVFVDFAFEKEKPVSAANLPSGCSVSHELPRELTFQESKKLAEIPADQKNTSMAWGAQLANKIYVKCP